MTGPQTTELQAQAAVCEAGDGCITCGDVAVEMRVVRIDAGRALALCEAEGGGRESVEIGLVEPVSPGDLVLVHAAVALVRLDRSAVLAEEARA